MEIWLKIEELISIIEHGSGSQEEDERRVIYLLDYLALSIPSLNTSSDFDGQDIPENDYQSIRKLAESRFPTWGFYNSVIDVSQKIGETELSVGDAIDDITDIINDLKMVMWSYKNECENNALWHLKDSYLGHWRWHIRNLQLYLHCRENEI